MYLSGTAARDQLMAQGAGPPGWIVAPSGSSYIGYPDQGRGRPGRGGASGGNPFTPSPDHCATAAGGTPVGSRLGRPSDSNIVAALARWGGEPDESHFTRPPDDTTITAVGRGGGQGGSSFTHPPDGATAAADASAPFTWRRLQVEVAGEGENETWQGGC
jgi:hypothetical protein